ncbi:Cytochrome oxidase biogenesis protein Surf1, facilitates heme A insertion [hydrothermal vent metagenome]|uniref:Cytochrome oxidase biogenesis protein Surf1, facilitates heme A insertion n=1 Tax=hydrothermal vent metagenome TaxID=652676 RepID=A0A3B0TTM1_9ZZZZ
MDEDNNTTSPSPDKQPGEQEPSGTPDLKQNGLLRGWFVVLMLVLTIVFVYFGVSQMEKLAEKERFVAIISERVKQAPISLPPVAEWVGFDPQIYNFRPITVSGKFDFSGTVLVFTKLSTARGAFFGPGYWVMAPFYLDGGGIVFINRGFVPKQNAAQFKQGSIAPQGPLTIKGLGRVSEPVNGFTPGTDFKNRIEWVRNIKRLSQFIDASNSKIAPIYIDAKAGETGALPQGGETRMDFANPHWQYMLIWFLMAAISAFIFLAWLFSKRKRTTQKTIQVQTEK